MRRLIAIFAVLTLCRAGAMAQSHRLTDEILNQVIPASGAKSDGMKVYPAATDNADQSNFSSLIVATGAVTNVGASIIIPVRATRSVHLLINECANDIRIGPSTVTGTVGLLVKAGATINLDSTLSLFRGGLYGINTAVGSCAWSRLEGTP